MGTSQTSRPPMAISGKTEEPVYHRVSWRSLSRLRLLPGGPGLEIRGHPACFGARRIQGLLPVVARQQLGVQQLRVRLQESLERGWRGCLVECHLQALGPGPRHRLVELPRRPQRRGVVAHQRPDSLQPRLETVRPQAHPSHPQVRLVAEHVSGVGGCLDRRQNSASDDPSMPIPPFVCTQANGPMLTRPGRERGFVVPRHFKWQKRLALTDARSKPPMLLCNVSTRRVSSAPAI
ncbi:hypothetical protein STIAU_6602 [Stigmatella aurantiaca DW4/3-1]|uniref:Uncharacterized protein n=1 Tax=Stigmatella aurantiaca (strain DW4/3-1) TaxID=378806 RepID=Q08Q93_STIAD|nr:hypothetical protein STIAU_6602 [Stigmatella aurantiaca DW4/3-1]